MNQKSNSYSFICYFITDGASTSSFALVLEGKVIFERGCGQSTS
ncbi:hypothetical protein [Vibrio sp. SS-MA-C1-2]|nr:hypothetical protein [Vibrio sp. SS-MA-C1-2]